ncbi:MAG: hypothetical protein ACRC57_13240 [Sarcina sp.]
MGTIKDWKNSINKYRKYIKNNQFIIKIYVKDLITNTSFLKYFFFDKKIDMIKFIKCVTLPTFIYNKINFNKGIEEIKVQEYKDVLNFFTSNFIESDKEYIKRYSLFYNRLEELEYDIENNREILSLINEMNKYFAASENIYSNLKIYLNIQDLFKELSSRKNELNEEVMEYLGTANDEEFEKFLHIYRENESVLNFILDIMANINDEKMEVKV